MENILFILGNGFDISLGLETSYSKFYEHYKKLPTTNKTIKALRDSIEKHTDNWSDFEKAFGEYTVNLKNQTEYDILHDDIMEELNRFITNEETIFQSKSYTGSEKLFSDLDNPYQYLRQVRQFNDIYKANNKATNIVSFNYTNTLESLCAEKNKLSVQNYIKSIEHIHNTLDKGLLFGVNDASQIKNIEFHSNNTICRELIKPNFNKSLGHGTDTVFKELINSASIICIFGSSLGETDTIWWELIAECLWQQQCRLIIFHWDGKEYTPTQNRLRIREELKIKDHFIKIAATNNSHFDIENVRDRIFIGYNTKMFQNIVNKEPTKGRILAIK